MAQRTIPRLARRIQAAKAARDAAAPIYLEHGQVPFGIAGEQLFTGPMRLSPLAARGTRVATGPTLLPPPTPARPPEEGGIVGTGPTAVPGALYRLTVASSLVQAGEADEAAAESVTALEHVAEVESGRVNRRLGRAGMKGAGAVLW